MLIKQQRIRSVARHLPGVGQGESLVIALTDLDRMVDRLAAAGFDSPECGDTLLPARRGPVSRFNAEGGWEVHRDKEMETAYRQVEWSWEQWCGYKETKTVTRIADVPYQRYPRTRIKAPGVEFTVSVGADGGMVLQGPAVEWKAANEGRLKHLINLFLELFGECSVLTGDLEPRLAPETRRLNWTILPAGRRPWVQLKRELKPVIDQARRGVRPVISHRFEFMAGFEPDFTATGNGGFSGYLVFGFSDLAVFVVESANYGNATYVFDSDWERLSRLSKAEIIDGNLHRNRVIHRQGWDAKIRAILGA